MSSNVDVERCYRVLEQADLEYEGKQQFTALNADPKRIIHTPMTALWGQSKGGEKNIDLKDPALRAYLKTLAAQGLGKAGVYDGVTYCFVCKLFPRFPAGYPVPDDNLPRQSV